MNTSNLRAGMSFHVRSAFLLLILFVIAATNARAQNQLDKCAILQAVNTQRSDNGLNDVTWNDRLEEAALVYTADQAFNGATNHVGSDGSTIGSRVTSANYNWTNVSENIASGQTSVTQVMTAWMNSAGHRANILDPNMTEFGAARIGNFWTQNFARPPGGGTSAGSSNPCALWLTYWTSAHTYLNQYIGSPATLYYGYALFHLNNQLGNYYYYQNLGQPKTALYNLYLGLGIYNLYLYIHLGDYPTGLSIYNSYVAQANAQL